MLTAYLKRQWKLLLLLAGAVAVFAAVFALYSCRWRRLPMQAFSCLMLGLILLPWVLRLSPAAPGAGRAFTKGP